MTTTLSVRIDTKKRLEALAKRARRSKSLLAAEAIAAFVEAESWQIDDIQKGLAELDEGRGVPHKDVANCGSVRGGASASERQLDCAHCRQLQALRLSYSHYAPKEVNLSVAAASAR